MRQSVRVRPDRRAVRWWSAAVLVVLLGAIFASHQYLLQKVGRALVFEDALTPADVIVVPEWAGRGGALEAVDLLRSGIAPRIAILWDPPDAGDLELERRGIGWRDYAPMLEILRRLGVRPEEVPEFANGTEEEADILARWCGQRAWRAVIVVSAPDHSRRLHRALRRTMRGHATQVLVRTARYASFNPDTWWRSHTGIRTAFEEWPKLMVDFVRHPLP